MPDDGWSFCLAAYGDENQAYDRIPGKLVTLHIPWARPLRDGETVSVEAVDTWGRIVAEVSATKVKVGGEGERRKFAIPVKDPLSRLWDVFASVRSGNRVLDRKRVWVGIPDWTFDDCTTMLSFGCEPSANGWKGDYNADLMRRKAGLNAVFSGDLMHGDASVMENNERHHLQTIAYFRHFGEDPDRSA